MTKMKVVKDASGKVINIGPWDYGVVHQATDEVDEQGTPITMLAETNPLPDGAYEDEADIIEGWDGGLYVAGDPRAERQN